MSALDVTGLVAALDDLLERVDDASFSQAVSAAPEDADAQRRVQREFDRARRALVRARESLVHIAEVS